MWTLLAAVVLSSTQPAFQVETLGGEVIAGPLLDVSAQQIRIDTADGPVALDVEDLAGLAPQSTPTPSRGSPLARPCVWIDLVDGSSLVAADYTATGGRARIALLDGQALELSTGEVAAVRFLPQTDAVAAEWARLVATRADSDLLVVRKGDAIDYHRGVLHDVTDTLVRFELDGDVLPVKRTKLHGLIYYRSGERPAAEPVCRLVDADGSRWVVKSISLAGGNLHWSTVSGLEVARPLSAVVRVDFSQGKVVYLSDLKPDSVQWTPFFGGDARLEVLARFFRPRQDESLRSGPLELDGRQYHKGLALHSRTSLEYRLPGEFRRFKATVGIDDRVRPRGSAQLVIRGDDRILLETMVAGTEPPKPIDFDLTGVRRLSILVDFGDDLDVADDVDLCEARIVK